MKSGIIALVISCLVGVALPAIADDSDAVMRAEWRRIFDGVAPDYELSREPGGRRLTLLEPPAYTWARSGPHGGTYGCVYIWTDRGNAEAVACFWRNPGTDGTLSVVHELHSLSPVVLRSTGKESDSWKPKAGLKRYPLSDSPAPAASASGRMQQMRTLCRDFSASSVSARGERTELRLLPQPLYRYESTNPDVVDGAVFGLVCSIGTDPEVFLLLEALKEADGPRWHYALARFSHMNLFVSYKNKEVWQAIRDQDNTMAYNADHTYWVFGRPPNRIKLDDSSRK